MMEVPAYRRTARRFVVALALMAASLIAIVPATTLAADSELFDDLGGHDGIEVIVERFLFGLADDERISHHFIETNIDRFYEKLVEHVCVLADGPCVYTGDTMERVHAGMNLDDADFNALVEVFIEAMEEVEVPVGAQNRLLARMAKLYPEIVYR